MIAEQACRLIRFVGLQVNGLAPGLLGDLRQFMRGRTLAGWGAYLRDLWRYRRHPDYAKGAFRLRPLDLYPCYTDRYATAGSASGHYFWMDLWAARKVHDSRVVMHYDIGSRLDGFIAHCLPFCEVTMLDVRPLGVPVPNLRFRQVDCTNMADIADESLASLSCLHAAEHFGLGRYGDPVDPLAYRRAFAEFQRVLAPGGQLYLAVPIGRERLEFNAHRVFNPLTIVEEFPSLRLLEFGAVDDCGEYHGNADMTFFRQAYFACGMFHFTKARPC